MYKNMLQKASFYGGMTLEELRHLSECVRIYKGHAISFGKYWRDTEGRAWWNVRVWKIEGDDCIGVFQAVGGCATDAEAMVYETRWAKEHIDALLG